jgi:CubicO group peptidase (beta-lactamase class C family)
LDLLPEAHDPDIDPRAREITIRDLLTMTSGFDPSTDAFSVGGMPASKMWTWMLKRPMSNMPGSRFNYDTPSVNLLSAVLTKAIPQSPRRFAEQNLLTPLKIFNYAWPTDSEGNLVGGDSLALSATDMAKIGLLYLQKGRWGDRQIVSESFVEDSIANHNASGIPARPAYGYLWWVKADRKGRDAFFAAGVGSQLIYVAPELDLVIAMASASSVKGGSTTFIKEIVLPAIKALATTPQCISLQNS